jgi:tocopherol O-methyltransferase
MEKSKEKLVGDIYDHWSANMKRTDFFNETLSIHYGYYTKGTKTPEEAALNMNIYVAKLLQLENKKDIKILDAGCGLGGSSLFLAKKYTKVSFTGIANSQYQIRFASDFAKKHEIKNAKFVYGDYINTKFPDDSFNGIFAIESAVYAENHQAFLNEMNRILKKGGRLVIIDTFCTTRPLNFIMKKIYQKYCYGFGYVEPATIPKYVYFLNKSGFTDIHIEDISKNVAPDILRHSVKSLIKFSIELCFV